MAGIKIHQYPLERTSIGDEDYYDIDYWTGSGYQSAKIKGYTLKNVLGANYIDITSFISGYDLTDKDAGKLITNSNANVRTLVIPSGLALPNNMITVKGRIGIQPETGVNITLPDGSTITEPTQFTCEADEVYILHKSGFTGDNYILVSLKKSENIGTNDLIISDTVRELQVAENGTFQIVTNDAFSAGIFKVGENSNERFSEVQINSVTFEQTIAEPNPTGAGILVDVNPNEFGIEGRSDMGDSGTKRNRLYFSPNEVVLEKSNAGKLTFNSLGAVNTFEDLRAIKKGLEYSADYSADFSVRSLVDKAYVDANSGVNIYNGTDVSPLTKRSKIRFTDFLGAVDDAIEEETVVSLDSNITKDVNTSRFGLNLSDEVDLKIPHERLTVGDVNGNATNLTGTEGNLIGFKEDNKITEFEGVEAFNILRETGITGDKQLALIGIDGVASNLKATFIIDEILVINTTANSVTVNVGSTSGGTDIANAITIGANATVVLTLGTRYFSSTLGQNLFISSASWNSANVTISVTVKKVHYV